MAAQTGWQLDYIRDSLTLKDVEAFNAYFGVGKTRKDEKIKDKDFDKLASALGGGVAQKFKSRIPIRGK